jgi:hypothetical protein
LCFLWIGAKIRKSIRNFEFTGGFSGTITLAIEISAFPGFDDYPRKKQRQRTGPPQIVEATEQQQLAAAAQVTSIPTLMAFRDGILVFRQAGALPPQALAEVIEAVRGLDMEDVRRKIAEA